MLTFVQRVLHRHWVDKHPSEESTYNLPVRPYLVSLFLHFTFGWGVLEVIEVCVKCCTCKGEVIPAIRGVYSPKSLQRFQVLTLYSPPILG